MKNQDNFPPVVIDTTFRIVGVFMLWKDWKAKIVDIETTFFWRFGQRNIHDDSSGTFRSDRSIHIRTLNLWTSAGSASFFKKLRDVLIFEMGF